MLMASAFKFFIVVSFYLLMNEVTPTHRNVNDHSPHLCRLGNQLPLATALGDPLR